MSRVRSVSSPLLLLVFLVISMGLAAPIIPLAESVLTTASGFFVLNSSKVRVLALLVFGPRQGLTQGWLPGALGVSRSMRRLVAFSHPLCGYLCAQTAIACFSVGGRDEDSCDTIASL